MLTIELVPNTCWFSNVRSHVPPDTWKLIQQSTFKKANYRCEICGGKGDKHPVECHEEWEYSNNTQTLIKCISLCPQCHQVKHIGLAQIKGNFEEAKNHLKKVNNWNEDEANRYIENSFILYKKRSKQKWNLNTDFLKKEYNIDIITSR